MPNNLLINDYPIYFIAWNLFLLLVPFFLLFILEKLWSKDYFRARGDKAMALILFLTWLLFVPNTAYVIVDARHLAGYCPDNSYRSCITGAWLVLFFFSYALIGLIAYVHIMHWMSEFLKKAYNELFARWFVLIVIPLISLGVLLGLVDRWNSWDIITHPELVLADALKYFTDYRFFENLIAFTLFYYLFYFAGRRILIAPGKRKNDS